MNMEGNFATQRRKFRKCRNRNGHGIPDAGGLNDDQVRMPGDQLSAQVSNHLLTILPSRVGCRFQSALTCRTPAFTMKMRLLFESESAGNMKKPVFVGL